MKLSKDINGNKVLKITRADLPGAVRGLTVQTNGNLPNVHRMQADAIDPLVVAVDLAQYLRAVQLKKKDRPLLVALSDFLDITRINQTDAKLIDLCSAAIAQCKIGISTLDKKSDPAPRFYNGRYQSKQYADRMRDQWDGMRAIPVLEYELNNGDFLTVNLEYTAAGIEFGIDTRDFFEPKIAFSGEIVCPYPLNRDRFLLPFDPFFDSLDRYLQQIDGEIVEGFLLPNDLYNC
jgi:hypothetical protein